MRPTFKEFKNKVLEKPAVKKEYEILSSTYESKKQLIRIIRKGGLA